MTFTELTALITFYAENDNTDWLSHIPDFIRSAESDAWFTIRAPQNKFNIDATFIAPGTTTIPVATDSPTSIHSLFMTTGNDIDGPWRAIEYRDETFLDEAYPGTASSVSVGTPRYYSTETSDVTIATGETSNTINLRIAPQPNGGFYYRVRYFGFPESVTTITDGITWLSHIKPDVLLYGALHHGYIAMKADEGTPLMKSYEDEFLKALAELKIMSEISGIDDAYRPASAPVAQ